MKSTDENRAYEFQQLYHRQVSRVYKLALFLLGNVSEAEDVSQIVFLKAWEKAPSFRDAEHEKAWFLRVTRNLCKDLQKNYFRSKRCSLDEAQEQSVEFESKEDSEVWQALMRLEDKNRLLLYLYYYEGYPVKELSKLLKRKESTVQTQLAAARKKMKELLQD